jgi:hypothetical protein
VTIAVRSGREEWKQEVGRYIPAAFADPLLDWWEVNDTLPTTGVRRVGRHGYRTRPYGLSSRRPPLESRVDLPVVVPFRSR